MSGNRFKKMRQYVRANAPANMPAVDYADINEHDKRYTYPPGTHIQAAVDIHPVAIPGVEGVAMPVFALVTVRQRVLDVCVKRAYKRLKTDVMRAVRGKQTVDWEKRDQFATSRAT